METVQIKFKNGSEIEAEVNGNSYIVDSKPAFPADLSEVIVGDQTLHYVEVVECAAIDNRYWFSFIEIPENIRKAAQMEANIEYIAIMSDIEL